jgi:hypothetical protein
MDMSAKQTPQTCNRKKVKHKDEGDDEREETRYAQ